MTSDVTHSLNDKANIATLDNYALTSVVTAFLDDKADVSVLTNNRV